MTRGQNLHNTAQDTATRQFAIRVYAVLMRLLLPICALASAGVAEPALAGDQWVIGYYVAYQHDLLPPESIAWDDLTHIVMGRVKANADGTLNTDFDYDAVNGPVLAKNIASRAHAAG